jgi:hypothetical protein
VVSDLSEGVDTVAHETTLVTGGHTVAVLGTPLDQVFPAKNPSEALQSLVNHELGAHHVGTPMGFILSCESLHASLLTNQLA